MAYLSTGFQFDAKRTKNMDLNVSFNLSVNVCSSATVASGYAFSFFFFFFIAVVWCGRRLKVKPIASSDDSPTIWCDG